MTVEGGWMTVEGGWMTEEGGWMTERGTTQFRPPTIIATADI